MRYSFDAGRVRGRLLTVLVAIGLLFTAVFANDVEADSPRSFTLTVLHNNDGESAVLPSGDEGGAARFATLLQQEKRAAIREGNSNNGVVFVSSGDNFLASPSFNASVANGIYYDAIALDRFGYDAIALGNHDFDFGPDVLADFIDDYRKPGNPPYLSANLDFSGEPALQSLADRGAIAASTIVRERGERIGIIGATTENLPFISSPRNVIVNAVQPAVAAEVANLEAQGVNKIILISHLQDIDGDILLAESLTGVDVMIAGGGDELLANPDDLLLPSDGPGDIFGSYPQLATDADGVTVPVVTTSGSYGYLGKLVVDFDEDGNVVSFDGGPLRVVDESVGPDGVPDDTQIQRRVVAPVEAYVADLAALVIGTSEVDLDGTRANVRSVETNEGSLIADSQLWQAQQLAGDFGVDAPQVALQNGGGIRNDSIIPAGDITELNTFEMVPFPNFVTVVPDIPRSQFKEILENAVSRNSVGDIPGGTGRFAQIAGFTFVYDGAGTAQQLDGDGNVVVAGTRIQTVTLDNGTSIVTGGTVVPGDPIDIAIVDFLARGGDEYPFRGAEFTAIGVSYQQALSNYIQGPLGGLISAADYPAGGEGRITRIN
jgi:5'-nucleotidase